ncbi:hypothetical protein [Pseudonocardia sp. NPDC046786]
MQGRGLVKPDFDPTHLLLSAALPLMPAYAGVGGLLSRSRRRPT